MNDKDKEKIKKRFNKNKISFILITIYSGICSIADLGVKYYFKDKKLETDKLAQYTNILTLPYIIRPLIGILIDTIPIFGYKRKSYLYISFFTNIIFWFIFLYTKNGELIIPLISQIFVNLGLSFTTVIGMAIRVELCKMYDIYKFDDGEKRNIKNEINDIYFKYRNLSILISTLLQGFLMEKYSYNVIFYLCAFFSLFILISAFILKERKISVRGCIFSNQSRETIYSSFNDEDEEENNKKLCCDEFCQKNSPIFCQKFHRNFWKIVLPIIDLLCNNNIIVLLILILILEILPSNSSTFFFYESNYLCLTQKEIGLIDFYSKVFTVIINYIYNFVFGKANFKCIIFFVKIFMFLNYSLVYMLVTQITQKYINDYYLIIITSCLREGLINLGQRPYSLLATYYSPKSFEATTSTLCVGASDLGHYLANQIDIFLTQYYNVTNYNFENLGIIIFIENVFVLIQILCITIIFREFFKEKET